MILPDAHVLKTLIFDLDGTLIDSAPGILSAFSQIFALRGLTPRVPLGSQIIGPPLAATLALLSGSEDRDFIAALVADFKRIYDQDAYRQSLPFAGIDARLHQLREEGYALHLATNKRIHPTRLIIEFLGWQTLFRSVYALDVKMPPFADKGEMLRMQLLEQGIDARQAVYIGDTDKDGEAAACAGLDFRMAAWGYGNGNVRPDGGMDDHRAGWHVLQHPSELI